MPDSMVVIYQICFGENFGMAEFNQSRFKLAIFIIATITLNVVILNLLIAIINNTYERLQNVSKATEIKQKALMLYESEAFMWTKPKIGQAMYLHVLQYDDGADEDGTGQDEWEGRLR